MLEKKNLRRKKTARDLITSTEERGIYIPLFIYLYPSSKVNTTTIINSVSIDKEREVIDIYILFKVDIYGLVSREVILNTRSRERRLERKNRGA